MFVPLVTAVVLGGLIGLEREIHRKPAGLRTNIMICLAAAVFTLIGRELSSSSNAEMTRLLAGVVTGVGFIGGGALIQDRKGVHGLTTAATIWLVAAIGVLCGLQLYSLAVGVTVIALLVLWGFSILDMLIHKSDPERKYTLEGSKSPRGNR